jgi:hypothetical protein
VPTKFLSPRVSDSFVFSMCTYIVFKSLICQQSYVTFSCSVKLFVTVVLCTVAQLLVVAPGSVEHQFVECRTKYRAHVAACFERAVGRTVHYSILAASAASVTVVKAGLGVALENGRNLFVVNLSASTNLWTCVDACGKMTYKGWPCVHILKALQSKGLPILTIVISTNIG